MEVQSYEIDHLNMDAVDEETILSSARPQLQLEKFKTITDPVQTNIRISGAMHADTKHQSRRNRNYKSMTLD